MKDQNDRIEIRISKELKESLAKLSKQSKRKVSDYIRLLIEYANENNIKL